MTTDGLHGRRILIVEDEGLIMLTILDIVQEIGCVVAGTAMTARAGLELVAGTPIDAALLDVNLGFGETSGPVADALAVRGVPFAFITGYSTDGVPARHRDRPVLSKPVDERLLEAALRTLLPVEPVRES